MDDLRAALEGFEQSWGGPGAVLGGLGVTWSKRKRTESEKKANTAKGTNKRSKQSKRHQQPNAKASKNNTETSNKHERRAKRDQKGTNASRAIRLLAAQFSGSDVLKRCFYDSIVTAHDL